MPNLVTGIAFVKGVWILPVDGIELLTLTAQLGQGSDCGVKPHQSIPCGRAYDAVRGQIKDLLKCPDRCFCSAAVDPVYIGNLGDRGIILGDAVQLCLNDYDIRAGASTTKGRARVRRGNAPNGCVGHDLYISVIVSQDLCRVLSLLGKPLAAPLA